MSNESSRKLGTHALTAIVAVALTLAGALITFGSDRARLELHDKTLDEHRVELKEQEGQLTRLEINIAEIRNDLKQVLRKLNKESQ